MSRRPTLPEPLQVDAFHRNRRHEAIVTRLLTIEGCNICDVRLNVPQAGRLVPTGKGVAVVVARLPDLAKAIAKAIKKAQALGLMDGPAGDLGPADDIDEASP